MQNGYAMPLLKPRPGNVGKFSSSSYADASLIIYLNSKENTILGKLK